MARNAIPTTACTRMGRVLCLILLCLLEAGAAQTAGKIRRVSTLGSAANAELEIEADHALKPEVQIVENPSRLVIDFPNATPGPQLRNLTVNRGEVKTVRVGLLTANPPVTRIVMDLRSPVEYQVFPSGKTVIVKVGNGKGTKKSAEKFETEFEVVNEEPPAPPVKDEPRMRVGYKNRELSIWADRATLAEIFAEVQRKTGADIPIPAGADQDLVIGKYGPGPPDQVLTAMLNGSRFNFIVVGSPDHTRLISVVLMPKGQSGVPDNIAPVNSPVISPVISNAAPPPPPEQPEPDDIGPDNPPDGQPGAQQEPQPEDEHVQPPPQ